MNDHELVAGNVYKATWRSLQVAVKKYVKVDGTGKPDYEEFARFYAEAAAMAEMNSPWVVQLHAVTRQQGKLVMELGKVDMVTWFGQHRSGGLPLKLSLLRNAAHGLADVHDKNFVHRDVRNKTFVVFRESPLSVKLVGLGSAMVGNATGKVTARKLRSKRWSQLNRKLCYEGVSERLGAPYGRRRRSSRKGPTAWAATSTASASSCTSSSPKPSLTGVARQTAR
ncbi:unnamed protein product [Ostreobium quekettii]|uniref:Protein kinase domain-containing protein n=1 Tax=Ostreobium quekettii TaxID=121088 RepID=A0A8S1J8M1_9CHLO|nr:unnamed protein product [Ostreobium quekettii]